MDVFKCRHVLVEREYGRCSEHVVTYEWCMDLKGWVVNGADVFCLCRHVDNRTNDGGHLEEYVVLCGDCPGCLLG